MEKIADQDLPTIASGAAVTAVLISTSYFYTQINKINEDLAEIKKVLAGIVPYVDPNTIYTVKQLNQQMARTQENIRIIMTSNPQLNQGNNKRVYTRYTQRYDDDIPIVSSSSIQLDDDINADIEAMRN